MRMRLLAVAAAVLAAAGTATIAAAPAHASIVDVTCAGTATATYNPGLTNTPHSTSFTLADDDALCLSSDPSITSGSDSTAFDIPSASCSALTAGGYLETVNWDNGSQSVIFYGTADVDVQESVVVVATGDVISGEFEGDTASQQNVYPLTDLGGCDSPDGLTTLSGTTSLILTTV